MLITVLTPSYNRSYILGRLYESLKNQTSSNFEWMIIDDGSHDDTKKIVNRFKEENRIKISYIFQKNGGKHRALNNGIKRINSRLTFIVDSDDYLSNDAIETIEFYDKKYSNRTDLCGFSFLRSYPDGKVNGPQYRQYEFEGNYIKDRINNHNGGDKAEVFYTEKLKEFPFFESEGENFLVESYVWFQLGLLYNTIYINKAIYYGDYLKDGLTKNIYKVRYKNPLGMIETYKLMCNSNRLNLDIRCKIIIKYIAYNKIANKTFSEQLKDLNAKSKFIFFMCYIFGILFYLYIKYKIKKE